MTRIISTPPAEDTNPYSYFTDELTQQIIRDLINRKGFTETQAYNALYSGGLSITSTQDPWIQQVCDEEVANEAIYPAGTEYGLDYALTITRADGNIENYSKEMLETYLRTTAEQNTRSISYLQTKPMRRLPNTKVRLALPKAIPSLSGLILHRSRRLPLLSCMQHTGKVKAIVGGRGPKTTSLSLNRATASPRQPGSCFEDRRPMLRHWIPAAIRWLPR